MRRTLFLAFLLVATALGSRADVPFDSYFVDRTMRVDYFHTGGPAGEVLALDQVVSDGAWAGSTTRLIDELNLGHYLFTVIDQESNRSLYSRGFSTLFNEWVTTPEAKSTHRTFHESLRFPWPRKPVRIVLEQRNASNQFAPLWSVAIDPVSRFVNPAAPAPRGEVWSVMDHGDPKTKVDLLILGEGYTATEMEKFRADVRRMVDVLFTFEPYKSRKNDFNVRAIDLPSEMSGVNRPQVEQFRRTPISVQYNIFDSERYALTLDNRALRDVAAGAPYEFVEILINEEHYGGGGIFNFQATASVNAGYANYLFVHEFGHHFAGLGDEYYTSDVAYETGGAWHPEPWEPNITALHDPAMLKWRDLVEANTPLPTPWDKATFEEKSRAFQERRRELRAKRVPESVMDEFFDEVKAADTSLLGSQKWARKVGAFEGASYEAKGLYRPEADCIMFTRDDVGFCRVCRRGIERVIDQYSR